MGMVALVTVPALTEIDVASDYARCDSDYRLSVNMEHVPIDSDEDIHGNGVEIPVSKRVVFKFGKPRKVLLY